MQRDVPALVDGDAGRLRQILFNLIGNAIKFTAQGEVLVEVASGRAPSPEEALLHFAVHDTGIGIAKEHQESIFHAFIQADGSATRTYGGTGLGLAIASELISMMGGHIDVESAPGEGSTFHFTIIVKRQSRQSVEEEQPLPAPATSQLSVLVASANSVSRRLLGDTLREWLPLVETVNNAQAMLEALRRHPYDVLLLDEQLEGFDAATLATRQAADGGGPPAVVLLLPHDRETDNGDRPFAVAAPLPLPASPADMLAAIHAAADKAGKTAVPPAGPADREAAAGQAGVPQKRRILVAEDDYINRVLITTILEREKWVVTAVENGRLAVDEAETDAYELILMDVQMPEMDGFAAAAAIRAKEKGTGRHIPIVALTAHAMKADRERCLAAGMDDYISKPVEYDALFALLEKFLPKH